MKFKDGECREITIEHLRFIAEEQEFRIEQFRENHTCEKYKNLDSCKWIVHMQSFLSIVLSEIAKRQRILIEEQKAAI